MSTRTFRAPNLSPRRLAGLAFAVAAATIVAASAPAYAAAVGLGRADSFAVLAGSGITNTGPTTITGDVGTFPTPTETGFDSVTLIGANHFGDAVTQGAKVDLVTAYDDAAARMPITNVEVELGGTTRLAGVYTSPTLGLTGTLTLDAQGDPNAQFVFKAGSTLIAEANSRVLVVNGANPCNVVWQVGSSATFKTGTSFVGDVLAHTSITAQTRATFVGRLLALNGAVTLDTNTITNGACATGSGDDATSTGVTTPFTTPAGDAATPGGTSSPSATPGLTTGGSTPASPSGTPTATPGTPTRVPGSPPSSPSGPPFLPATGAPLAASAAFALTLIAVGALALGAERRATAR